MDSPGMGVLALTQTATLFVALLPDVSALRKAGPGDQEFRNDVRTSEGIAAAISLGVGIGAGLLTKSATPVYVAFGSTLLLVGLSELLLRQADGKPLLTLVRPNMEGNAS